MKLYLNIKPLYNHAGFIRNGFEDICGTVDGITLYCGTDICPCSYAILELRNNIYFVSIYYCILVFFIVLNNLTYQPL